MDTDRKRPGEPENGSMAGKLRLEVVEGGRAGRCFEFVEHTTLARRWSRPNDRKRWKSRTGGLRLERDRGV